MRILLVDNNLHDAATMNALLRQVGFTVDQTPSGEDALEMMRHYDYDLVLLEVLLSDIEGYDVIRRARLARMNVPMLVLSSLSRPQAKVRAFAVGADDYITKPCDGPELVARLQAVLRRSRGFSDSTIKIGRLELDLNGKVVTIDEVPIHLTGKEYAILELLVLRKGIVQTKDAFLNHLYGGIDEPEMKIIDVFICKLRRKLQAKGAGNLISTVWGRGYVLRDTSVESPELTSPALPVEVVAA